MVLRIPFEIWQKLQLYVELSAPNEVTGIGTVVVRDAENLEVTEIFLSRQMTSPAVCEFEDGELNGIIYDLMEQNPERVSQLRFRWHSHGCGKVFWSQKDERDIESWEAPWVVNLVMNVQGDYLCRLDYFQPLRIREYPVKIKVDYLESALRENCAQELREKLTVMSAMAQHMRKEP